ncbi:MAG: AhpC/TSA family protein [Gomphosphaeria aponina SAG 52.96 = DSM 107014]|uniref:thioredoxin-dependent peroxiredoxin n=1 Tax=Gomphosphaeria aponina SAG 52.96 = DSM 107014 TaxID=1521640 RepID=A0A941JSV8_9CHRO|nr:AhpC/TSA family protein [Gomphosphaeria aponina SAG 52.96 = DSM 107014]
MNLQLELYKFQREFLARLPQEQVFILQEATAELVKEFQNRRMLRIDDEAPNFTLPDSTGKLVCLSEQLKKGAVILTFYRGGWCPYCNLELRAYQKLLPKIKALGACVLAVSPQTLAASKTTVVKNALQFDVLSDVGSSVARDYGIVFEIPDPLKQVYTELGHALPDCNGTNDWLLPVPATFIIDRSQHIALAYIDVDYSKRYEPLDAIAILLSLFVAT